MKAKFEPKSIETLKDSVKKYIGKVYDFEYMWEIEEGVYKGQKAYSCKEFGHWVPTEDLDFIK